MTRPTRPTRPSVTRRRAAALVALALAACLAPALARADDKADCVAAYDASQALRSDRKLTEAIAKFAVCARDVCPRSMQKDCAQWADEASRLLPTVVLAATDASHNGVFDVTVSVDGVVVSRILDGKAIPVDPGLHKFLFVKEGADPVERVVAVTEGVKGQMITAQVGRAEALPPPVVAPPTVVVRPVDVAPPPEPRPASTTVEINRTRGLALGAAGAGLLGLTLGVAYGELAYAKKSDSVLACGSSCAPGSPASRIQTTGEHYATTADVAFTVGSVLVAGGVALFIVGGPKTSAPAAAITPTAGGLALAGTFR